MQYNQPSYLVFEDAALQLGDHCSELKDVIKNNEMNFTFVTFNFYKIIFLWIQ